jgi:hypothetical protein
MARVTKENLIEQLRNSNTAHSSIRIEGVLSSKKLAILEICEGEGISISMLMKQAINEIIENPKYKVHLSRKD